jgi:hypothetical protein
MPRKAEDIAFLQNHLRWLIKYLKKNMGNERLATPSALIRAVDRLAVLTKIYDCTILMTNDARKNVSDSEPVVVSDLDASVEAMVKRFKGESDDTGSKLPKGKS